MGKRAMGRKRRLAGPALCGLTLLCASAGAEVYKWRDSAGRLHFTDEPPVNQKAEDLSGQYDFGLPFSINIRTVDYAMPADLKNRLAVAVRRIFSIYESRLEVEYPRAQDFEIVIYGDQATFRSYQRKVAPRLENPIGFYNSATNRISAMAVPDERALLGLITHECSHAVSASNGRYLPIWLNEGLAEYFSRMQLYGLTAEIPVSRHWLSVLRRRSYQDRPPDLAEHINALPPAWQRANGPDNHSYALSWSLVYFMMGSDQGRELIHALLKRAEASSRPLLDSAAMIERQWPGGLKAFTREWQSWLTDAKGRHRY